MYPCIQSLFFLKSLITGLLTDVLLFLLLLLPPPLDPLSLIHSLIHSLMLPIPLPSTQIAGNMSYHVYMPIILKELGFKVTERWFEQICFSVITQLPTCYIVIIRFPIIHLTPSSPLSTSTPPSSFPSLPARGFCVLMIHDIRGFMGIVCFTVRKKDKEGH